MVRLSWRALTVGVPLAAGLAYYLGKLLRNRLREIGSTQSNEQQQTQESASISNNASSAALLNNNSEGNSRTPLSVVNMGGVDGDEMVEALTKAIEQMTKNPPVEEKKKLPNQPTCTACHRPAPSGKSLQRCSRCKAVMYCSSECQVAAWGSHKATCGPRAELKKKLDEKCRKGSGLLANAASAAQRDELQRGASLCKEAAGYAADLRTSLTDGLGDFPAWWPALDLKAVPAAASASSGVKRLWHVEAEMRRSVGGALMRIGDLKAAKESAAAACRCAAEAGDMACRVETLVLEGCVRQDSSLRLFSLARASPHCSYRGSAADEARIALPSGACCST